MFTVLSILATEFESERSFSAAGRMCESRSRLNPESINRLIFIKKPFKLIIFNFEFFQTN